MNQGEVSSLLRRGIGALQAGNLGDAERCYRDVLDAHPGNFDALHFLGVVNAQLGRNEDAAELIKTALERRPGAPDALSNLGNVLLGLKRHDEALECYDRVLAINPGDVSALNNRGNALCQIGRYADAVASYDKALSAGAAHPTVLNNRGSALRELRRYDDALASYDQALSMAPTFAQVFSNRCKVLGDLGRFEEALASGAKAIELKPNYADAYCNLGNTYFQLERYDESIAAHEKALAISPEFGQAWLGRGKALFECNRYDEALAAHERALAIEPALAEAWLGMGHVLWKLKRYEEAVVAFGKARAIKPDLAEAWLAVGNLLFDFKRHAESLAAHQKALAIKPELAEAWFGCGKALFVFGQHEEALAAFDKAATLDPHLAYLNCARLWTRMLRSDWANWAAECERLISIIRDAVPTAPFVSLIIPATSADQLQCAKIHTEHLFGGAPAVWRGERYSHDRIRIAYLSADLRKGHPVAYLTAGLFALHDPSRFETTALSYGPADDSEFSQRLKGSFERFVDVRDQTDAQIGDLVRQLEIDVAIDLTGFLDGGRPGILALRPAPIQVNYLGYPGTMGADFIDYLIADAVIVPFEEQPFYAESIVHLPDTYWVTDMARRIVGTTPSRSAVGLPDNGFVFCCFNNTPKINRPVFEIWMRLLTKVPGSVLWLLRDNTDTERNLRREARALGVDPARVVFADRVDPEVHLARHRLADLFLDTLPYNAHTTATDALWMGLPVLTCLGSTFAGRVAASLLHAVGLPELITRSADEYEALGLKLAEEPVLLSTLKAKLENNRLTRPLFDTERFTRHIEAAYTRMWEIWQRGEGPRSFRVDSIETKPTQ